MMNTKDDECPYILRKLAGDETYDTCEINTKSCLIEHGLYECEIWNEIKLLSRLERRGDVSEYCPYCQCVRAMMKTKYPSKKVTQIEYHCASCHRYVRTEYISKPFSVGYVEDR